MPKARTKRAAVPTEPAEDEQMADAPAAASAAEQGPAIEEAEMEDAAVVDMEAEDDAVVEAEEEEEPMRVRLVGVPGTRYAPPCLLD